MISQLFYLLSSHEVGILPLILELFSAKIKVNKENEVELLCQKF
ncbi:hypothetical protein FMV2238Y02_12560 [Streptococcus canis]|uniref:Uncharacterized protein n=1 Tax=Streptococcus canis TaxID=1329 RepID=A0A3P5Y9S7_STRCB|nr:hypothetical protein FMV2238Y02_12560 [Streptococcus canis]